MSLQGKISIVIPCFNHGSLLLETLASIERASIDSLMEVIIVNDGSNDPDTCRVFENLDTDKYKILHQDNRGLSAARNAGIAVARGEFVLPVDSDNYIRQVYLTDAPAILLANPSVGVVYGDPEFFGQKTGRRPVPDFNWTAMVKMNYIDASALFRKSVWESVGGYDEKMRLGWEDWDFWLRVALRGWKFVHLDAIAFDYRVRKGSMLSGIRWHRQEMLDYIFGKPEFEILSALRVQAEQLEELSRQHYSVDYRLGNTIVTPFRKLRRLPSRILRRLRNRPGN